MVERLWDEIWRGKAQGFFSLLETNPTNLIGFYSLAEQCREEARRLKREEDTHDEWVNRLKELKIPYPVKSNEGYWYPWPKTQNLLDKRSRGNMKKSDRGRGTSINRAMEENTWIPQLEMGIRDAVKVYLEGKTQTFLSNLLEEE